MGWDFRTRLAIASLALLVLLFWIQDGWGGDEVTLAAVDLANLAAPLLAAFACFRRSLHEEGRAAGAWKLLALACIAWAWGALYVAYFELWVQRGIPFADRTIPFPSPADVGYVAFMPLAVLALVRLPKGVFRSRFRFQLALDAGLLALSVLGVVWWLVLADLTTAGPPGELATLLALLYPWIDIVLATVALLALSFVPENEKAGILLVGLGALLLAAADVGFYYIVSVQPIGIPSIILLWPAGFLCMALGTQRVPMALQTPRARSPTPVLAMAVAASLTVAVAAALTSSLDPTHGVLALLVVVLAFVRVAWAAAEQRRLQRPLPPAT